MQALSACRMLAEDAGPTPISEAALPVPAPAFAGAHWWQCRWGAGNAALSVGRNIGAWHRRRVAMAVIRGIGQGDQGQHS
jgi:hypothetical protein